MASPRYLLMPGWITSRTDGDQHYINEVQLMRLYGVSPAECVSARNPGSLRGIDLEVLVPLRPRYDGDYTLARTPEPSGDAREEHS